MPSQMIGPLLKEQCSFGTVGQVANDCKGIEAGVLSPAKSTCQKYKLLTQYRCASTACWLILVLAPEKRGGNRGDMSTVS